MPIPITISGAMTQSGGIPILLGGNIPASLLPPSPVFAVDAAGTTSRAFNAALSTLGVQCYVTAKFAYSSGVLGAITVRLNVQSIGIVDEWSITGAANHDGTVTLAAFVNGLFSVSLSIGGTGTASGLVVRMQPAHV